MPKDIFVPHKRTQSQKQHKTVRMTERLIAQVKNCVDYNSSSDSRVICECVKCALHDLGNGFEIQPNQVITGAEQMQFRIEQEWIEWITRLSKQYNVSFDKIVSQCVNYVLNVKYKD